MESDIPEPEHFTPGPEEIERTREILLKFSEWLVRELDGEIPVYAVPDLIANLYLRMRMHLKREVVEKILEDVHHLVEHKIESGDLRVVLPGGDMYDYHPAEFYEGKEELRDMLIDAAKEVTDEELEEFLAGGLDGKGGV